MDLPFSDRRKGASLAAECLGTCILVAAYCINLQQHSSDGDVIATTGLCFAMPAIYFVVLMLTLPLSGAQLNPALTIAVYIANGEPQKWSYAVMNIVAQTFGGLLGMQVAHLLRFQYGSLAIPAYMDNIPAAKTFGHPNHPGIIAAVILSTEIIFTLIFALVYLNAKYSFRKCLQQKAAEKEYQDNELGLQFAAVVAISAFYCDTIANEISAGYMNPIVGFILGFQTKKYYYMEKTSFTMDPMWAGDWAPLTLGPFAGAVLAGIFFLWQKGVRNSLDDDIAKPFFHEDNEAHQHNSPKHESPKHNHVQQEQHQPEPVEDHGQQPYYDQPKHDDDGKKSSSSSSSSD